MLRIRSSMAARVQRSRHSRMGRTGDGWPRRTGPHGANMVSRHSPAAAPAMENARATPSPRFSPSSSTPARAALAQDDDTRAALERMATEGDKVIPHKSTVDITLELHSQKLPWLCTCSKRKKCKEFRFLSAMKNMKPH